jgi:hypothetical protein
MKIIVMCLAILCSTTFLPAADTVLFDLDLTQGPEVLPTHGVAVTGGRWDDGWTGTGAKDERLVLDAGRPIASGCLEVQFTIAEPPWKNRQGKINWVGLHEDASLNQNRHVSDLFYARTGDPNYKFSKIKATGREFDRTEYVPCVGHVEDWICDGKTIHAVKLEWRDGVPIFHEPQGPATIFPRDVVGSDAPVDRLRYAFLGSDCYTGLTVKGLRFLRVRFTDYGTDAEGPAPAPLSVHKQGRFLVDAHGRPVFLLADTAWGLSLRLNREQITSYLRHRRSQRFNAVTFVIYSPGHPDIDPSGDTPYGHAPFQAVNGKADPTQPLTSPGNDPRKKDEYDYWDHVDFAIQEMRRLGLYALALPTWGTGVTGSYDGKAREKAVFDEQNAYAYGRWLGQRYGDQPHVLWMLGGDVAGAYTKGNDFTAVFRAMARGLAEGTGKGSAPLMSFHPQKPNPQSSAWFHGDGWLSFNSIQAWPEAQIGCVTGDWSRAPAKPTWLFEGRYEAYWTSNYRPDQWGAWQCRQQAYQTVFAGAFGHTYGHERVFGFGKDGWDWKKELDAPGARSMTHLAKLMNGIGERNLLARVPDPSLLADETGKAERLVSDRILALRTTHGSLALIYSASGRSIRVRMDRFSKGPLFGWWFNPRNGKWHVNGVETEAQKHFANDLPAGPGTPVREFDAPGQPGEGNDWVLILCTSEGP